MKKRGLSDVITTLIIVLLSLVAIGIVWVVISNIIKSGEQQTSFQFGTLFLDLQLEKVVVNTNGDVSVTVERGVGEGDLAGVAFVFSDGTKSATIKRDAVISELGSQVFTFTPAELQELAFVKQVEIAPILTSNDKEQIGRAVDSYDNSEDYNVIFEGNLIEDPLFKNTSKWSTGWTKEFVDLSSAGVGWTDSCKIVTTTNVQIYSDYAPVDSSKKYKFTLWIKQNSAEGSLYLGYDAYGASKTEINSYNRAGTTGNNSYFWSGDLIPSGSWKKITGYIMPCGTSNNWVIPLDATRDTYRMDCATKFLRIRFLNYDAPAYGTGAGATAWYALPRIEESA